MIKGIKLKINKEFIALLLVGHSIFNLVGCGINDNSDSEIILPSEETFSTVEDTQPISIYDTKEQKLKNNAETRSKKIQEAEDSVTKLLEFYKVLGEYEIDGKTYYKVSLISDDNSIGLFNKTNLVEEIPCGIFDDLLNGYDGKIKTFRDGLIGLYNPTTHKEDVPCKYSYISNDTFEGPNGQLYRCVNIPHDRDYRFQYGWLNMTTFNEDIPCLKYDFISNDTFEGPNGQLYKRVSVPGDTEYKYGWLNMKTFNEDIPCLKYDFISNDTFEGPNGQLYKHVSVPGDTEYKYGWLNMKTFNEDIPCLKYDFISNDTFEGPNGQLYKHVSVPGDAGVPGNVDYIYGWLNMTTFKEDVECKTYIDSEIYTIDGKEYYQFITSDGKAKILGKTK